MSANPPDSPVSPEDLLASLLSSFGKTAPKAKKPSTPKPRKPVEILPVPQAFATRKTGYRVWKATARVIQLQKQICKCCGEETTAVKGEFFSLENGQAHAVWLRPEGYGISTPESLPITYTDLEDTYVTACATCRSTPFDDLALLFHPLQQELPL